jgi:hypothetical protein
MPIFRGNRDIFKNPDQDEVFNENWMDSDKLVLPPSPPWDYSREMTIDDVDIWEQIYYETGGQALYAAYCPFAEFYLITTYGIVDAGKQGLASYNIETFYGANAGKQAYARAKQLGMPIQLNTVWVEPEDMWLYTDVNSNHVSNQ